MLKTSHFENRKKMSELLTKKKKELEEIRRNSNSVQMKVFLNEEHKEWLRKKAYEGKTNMSAILRNLIEKEMKEEENA